MQTIAYKKIDTLTGKKISNPKLICHYLLENLISLDLAACLFSNFVYIYYAVTFFIYLSKSEIISELINQNTEKLYNIENSQENEKRIDSLHKSRNNLNDTSLIFFIAYVFKIFLLGTLVNPTLKNYYQIFKNILSKAKKLTHIIFLIFFYIAVQSIFFRAVFAGKEKNITLKRAILISTYAFLGNLSFFDMAFKVSKFYGLLNCLFYIIIVGYLLTSLFRVEFIGIYHKKSIQNSNNCHLGIFKPKIIHIHFLNEIINILKCRRKKLAVAPLKSDMKDQLKAKRKKYKITEENIEKQWENLGKKYIFISPEKLCSITKTIDEEETTLREYGKNISDSFSKYSKFIIPQFILLVLYLINIYNMTTNRNKTKIFDPAITFRNNLKNVKLVANSPGNLATFFVDTIPIMISEFSPGFGVKDEKCKRDFIFQPKKNLQFQSLYIKVENFEMTKNKNPNSAFSLIPNFKKKFWNKTLEWKGSNVKNLTLKVVDDVNEINDPKMGHESKITLPNEIYEFVENGSKFFLNDKILLNATSTDLALTKLAFNGLITANINKLELLFTYTNSKFSEIYMDEVSFKRGYSDYFKPNVKLETITFFTTNVMYILGISTLITIFYELIYTLYLFSEFKKNILIYNNWYKEAVKNRLEKKELAQRSMIKYEFFRKMEHYGYLRIISSVSCLLLTLMLIYTTRRFFISYNKAKPILENRKSGPIENDISVLIILEELKRAQNFTAFFFVLFALLRFFSLFNWVTKENGRIFRKMIYLTIISFLKVGIPLIIFSVFLGFLINIYIFNIEFDYYKLYDIEIYLFEMMAIFNRREINFVDGMDFSKILINILIIPLKYLLLTLVLKKFKTNLKILLENYLANKKQSEFLARRDLGSSRGITKLLGLTQEGAEFNQNHLKKLKRLNKNFFSNDAIYLYQKIFEKKNLININSGLKRQIFLLRDVVKEYEENVKILKNALLGIHILKQTKIFKEETKAYKVIISDIEAYFLFQIKKPKSSKKLVLKQKSKLKRNFSDSEEDIQFPSKLDPVLKDVHTIVTANKVPGLGDVLEKERVLLNDNAIEEQPFEEKHSPKTVKNNKFRLKRTSEKDEKGDMKNNLNKKKKVEDENWKEPKISSNDLNLLLKEKQDRALDSENMQKCSYNKIENSEIVDMINLILKQNSNINSAVIFDASLNKNKKGLFGKISQFYQHQLKKIITSKNITRRIKITIKIREKVSHKELKQKNVFFDFNQIRLFKHLKEKERIFKMKNDFLKMIDNIRDKYDDSQKNPESEEEGSSSICCQIYSQSEEGNHE